MPEKPSHPASATTGLAQNEGDELRVLSRSPHPYHRQNFELLHPSERLAVPATPALSRRPPDTHDHILSSSQKYTKESTPSGDSGTEADDEHFLKGLPAPKGRLHKGLRGRNEVLSGASTPLLSPGALDEDVFRVPPVLKKDYFEKGRGGSVEKSRRRREVVRRSTEILLLAVLAGCLYANPVVSPIIKSSKRELLVQSGVIAGLFVLYPFRLVIWAYRERHPSRWIPISLPASFDPAPILYPPVIPLFVSLLLAGNTTGSIQSNLILGICSLPGALIPAASSGELYNPMHWLLSCMPMFLAGNDQRNAASGSASGPTQETGALLYPLHQTLCLLLHNLTTTSLLSAELQLLSVALTNLLLLSTSPQAVILKAVLCGGGIGIMLTCDGVIKSGITLARVPKWRFRRLPIGTKQPSFLQALPGLVSLRKVKYELLGSAGEDSTLESEISSDEQKSRRDSLESSPEVKIRHVATGFDNLHVHGVETVALPPINEVHDVRINGSNGVNETPSRRHTLPSLTKLYRSKTHTPSGRRKRSASSSVRAFFSLTQAEAVQRTWWYAGYLYACILAIILAGVRMYVGMQALHEREAVGWALGYLFGDLPWFRFQVVKANLERWVCLPPLSDNLQAQSRHLGWVEHLRHASFGEANTRLIMSTYWVAILVLGLAVVFQLSPVYEVDTRRKVFHFMMVAMFLPATFVDPTYAALALSLILAIFLLLDLLRASQLPPLSKPIAAFLAPYVDGRDHRGPVVISHLFLLIGCAIPLWLSLAALSRTGSGCLQGWEVPSRDVSMVSGIVCVGLGDAAASLIGRRWGHQKWLWGGGKSLEGSVAFAIAVFAGLMAASIWLHIGGWPVTGEFPLSSFWDWNWHKTAGKAGFCASVASLTEAVLTGGNDNVVVPVMLWTCVKSLGL